MHFSHFQRFPAWLGVAWLVGAGTIPAREESPPAPQILRSAAEVHRLTPRESARGMPVKMKGTITYIRGMGPELTIQDATGGVCLDWLQQPGMPPLRPGLELEIEGTTAVNPPTPRVKVRQLRITGNPGLPAPRVHTLTELLTADLEASYVEFTAPLRSVGVVETVEPKRLALEFGPAHSRLSVWISRWGEETRAAYLPGAMVRIRGVLLRWKTVELMPYSTFAVAHDPSWVSVVKPPPPPENLPLLTIPDVLYLRADAEMPLRVRGVITLDRSPHGLVIQDEDAALWVRPRKAWTFRQGDRIEATGFPGPNGARKELEDAELRWIGHAPLPEPVEISQANIGHKVPQWKDGHYARVSGLTGPPSVSEGGLVQWLDFGNKTLKLRMPAESGPLPAADTMVEATGVLEAQLNRSNRQTGWGLSDYELHLQSLSSLTVLRPPPWWTQQRLLAALGIIVLLAGGAGLWALALRRRVAEKSAQLEREITARHDQELLAAERQRLARDLHDTLEQTLTGAALQLDAVEAMAPDWQMPGPRDPLELARRLLDRSRDELRRAVWDLTPGLLEEQGLAAALAVMAEEQSSGGSAAVSVQCGEEAAGLPDRLAAHLCRIAQEATHNAIRHGQARQITINLAVRGGEVCLTVEDDGAGFNPALGPGIETGHFGVNGMKERMRRLGGRLEILSVKGEGTIVRAVCPAAGPLPDPQAPAGMRRNPVSAVPG